MLEKIISALKTVGEFEPLDNAKEINIKIINDDSIEIETESCDEEAAVEELNCECKTCSCNEKNGQDAVPPEKQKEYDKKDKLFMRLEITRLLAELCVCLNEFCDKYGVDDLEIESLNEAVSSGSELVGFGVTVEIKRR